MLCFISLEIRMFFICFNLNLLLEVKISIFFFNLILFLFFLKLYWFWIFFNVMLIVFVILGNFIFEMMLKELFFVIVSIFK